MAALRCYDLKTLKDLKRELNSPRLENIEVPAAYCIAAESTAGSAVFNLLVGAFYRVLRVEVLVSSGGGQG